MEIKFLLLLVGVLVIHSKSEPLRFEKQNFDSHGSVNSNSGSQHSFPNYRSDQGLTSDLRNSDYGSRGSVLNSRLVPQSNNNNYGSQGSFPGYRSNQETINEQNPHFGSQDNIPNFGSMFPVESKSGLRDPHYDSRAASGFGLNQRPSNRPDNFNYGSQVSYPGLRSNQGPINRHNPYLSPQDNAPTFGSNYPREFMPEPINSHKDSQTSLSGFEFNQGLPTRRDNPNYGSQVSYPGLRSNQEPISRQNPYHDPQEFSPSSGSNMGFDQNFPLLWQLETTEVIDQDALRNNPSMVMDHFHSVNLWRLQPLQDNTNSNNLRRLPKSVLLNSKVQVDYSKPNGTLTINGNTMVFSSFRVVKSPSIDDVRAIYNPHSPEAPIYITVDANWPVLVGFNNGKLILIFYVRRVYF